MKTEIKSNSELDVKRPEPGIYAGVPFGKYCRLEAENQTTLKTILVSPLHYREAKKKNAERDSVALRDGRIVHSMVLEAGAVASRVAVWPGERRGKVWDAVAIRHEGGTLVEHFAVFYDGKVRNGKAWEAFKAEMEEFWPEDKWLKERLEGFETMFPLIQCWSPKDAELQFLEAAWELGVK